MATPLQNRYVLTRFDLFQEVLQECPRAGELLFEYGLHCASCYLNEFDTVETGARLHDMTEDEMIEMIEEINDQLAKEWQLQGKQPL